MASFSRPPGRPNGGLAGFSRADLLAALTTLHIKPSELQLLFHCSPSIARKLMARPDFPRPVELTGDGRNARYAVDEVMTWRNEHRRVLRALDRPRERATIAPPPSAEAAVRAGLEALRGERKAKKPTPTQFR